MYATQKDGKVLGTSSSEIEQFIGILLLTGVLPCTSYRLYWAKFCQFNMIADVMSRNRFELLLRYIHFNDNTNIKPREHPQYDPLFKISPLLNHLCSAMQSIEPEEMHAIDEQMIPFKGRSSMKQYMKKSPISGVSKCLHEQVLQASYMTLKFTLESLCNCLMSLAFQAM